MAASWTGICNSKPPMVYFSARENRHTYDCIMHSRAFTVNVASAGQVAIVDYFGMASGRSTDKFAAAKVTAVKSDVVAAPYIAEFPLVLECDLAETYALGSHTMFLGEIKDVKCREEFLDSEGRTDTAKIAPFIYATGDSTYHAIGELLGGGYKLGTTLNSK